MHRAKQPGQRHPRRSSLTNVTSPRSDSASFSVFRQRQCQRRSASHATPVFIGLHQTTTRNTPSSSVPTVRYNRPVCSAFRMTIDSLTPDNLTTIIPNVSVLRDSRSMPSVTCDARWDRIRASVRAGRPSRRRIGAVLQMSGSAWASRIRYQVNGNASQSRAGSSCHYRRSRQSLTPRATPCRRRALRLPALPVGLQQHAMPCHAMPKRDCSPAHPAGSQ